MFVVDKGSVGPECAGDLFASEEFAGPLQKHEEHLEGLSVEFDTNAFSTKLAKGAVGFEYSEAVAPGWLWGDRVSHTVNGSWPV